MFLKNLLIAVILYIIFQLVSRVVISITGLRSFDYEVRRVVKNQHPISYRVWIVLGAIGMISLLYFFPVGMSIGLVIINILSWMSLRIMRQQLDGD